MGPLPAKASFYCAGSTQVFLVSGSAWTKTASTWIGMNILIDGNNVGTASLYANEAWSHKAVVEDPVVLHLTPGSHNRGALAEQHDDHGWQRSLQGAVVRLGLMSTPPPAYERNRGNWSTAASPRRRPPGKGEQGDIPECH